MKKALGQLGLASIPSFIQRLLLNTGAHWSLSRPQIAKSDGTGCKVMNAVVQDSGETGLSDFGSLKGMWNKGLREMMGRLRYLTLVISRGCGMKDVKGMMF